MDRQCIINEWMQNFKFQAFTFRTFTYRSSLQSLRVQHHVGQRDGDGVVDGLRLGDEAVQRDALRDGEGAAVDGPGRGGERAAHATRRGGRGGVLGGRQGSHSSQKNVDR